ncbi:DUF6233 domain-containing protein [Streptomyces sp. NPDC047821]|uniref:DUF6233 domain-containing protein n=1 Tax=Streptomyces sp. NPDC047821 TaxID=3365488 RepID=UPI003722C94C
MPVEIVPVVAATCARQRDTAAVQPYRAQAGRHPPHIRRTSAGTLPGNAGLAARRRFCSGHPADAPAVADPAPDTRWAWKVHRRRARAGAPATVVHTADCELAGGGPELYLDQALDALRHPGAVACTACDAAADFGWSSIQGAAWEVPDATACLERCYQFWARDFSEPTARGEPNRFQTMGMAGGCRSRMSCVRTGARGVAPVTGRGRPRSPGHEPF